MLSNIMEYNDPGRNNSIIFIPYYWGSLLWSSLQRQRLNEIEMSAAFKHPDMTELQQQNSDVRA